MNDQPGPRTETWSAERAARVAGEDTGYQTDIREGVVVRPGDTLVVLIAEHADPDACDHIHDQLGGRLPGVDVLVVAGPDQLAVIRPQEGNRP